MPTKLAGKIILAVAGVIIIGLLSHWTYPVWRVVDVVIVAILLWLGVSLVRTHEDINFKGLLTKYKKTLVVIIVILVVLGAIIAWASWAEAQAKKCSYSLNGIIENRYQQDEEDDDLGFLSRPIPGNHKTYWEIDGMLKNTSPRGHKLNGIVLKIYTNDENNILLTEGYLNVREDLQQGQSFPFQVRAQLDRRDPVLSKYFEKDDDVRIDVYPWFTTCK